MKVYVVTTGEYVLGARPTREAAERFALEREFPIPQETKPEYRWEPVGDEVCYRLYYREHGATRWHGTPIYITPVDMPEEAP